jgi:hypothetical protein
MIPLVPYALILLTYIPLPLPHYPLPPSTLLPATFAALELEMAPRIRKCFSPQFKLNALSSAPSTSSSDDYPAVVAAMVESAIADGSNWVLKPQREGGGNNLCE